MSKMQTVSIVVPAYNEEQYIGQCLDALANELGANDEIIVVDNNSADDTAAIVGRYSRDDKRVKLLSEKTQGTMQARKTGFDQAKGDFIGTVDSDTIVLEGWRDEMISGITILSADAVSSYGLLKTRHMKGFVSYLSNYILFSALPVFLGTDSFMFGTNYILRRDSWRLISSKVRLEKDIWDDYEVTLLLDANNKKLAVIRRKLYEYSTRRSLDSPMELYRYGMKGAKTLRHFHKIRSYFLPILGFFTIGIAVIMLKPINAISETTKSD